MRDRRPLTLVLGLAVMAVGALPTLAAAQSVEIDTTKDLAVTEIMGLPVPGPMRSDDVTPAVRAIERMVAAYRAAPFLVDEMRLQETYMGQRQPEVAGRVVLGAGLDAEIQAPSSRAVALDGKFYFERNSIRSRYLRTDLKENIAVSMREIMFTRPALGWQVKSRFGDPADSVLFALSFGVPDPTTITGYERATLPDGRDVHRVTLMAKSGWSVVTIDAKTDFLIAIDVDYKPAGAPIETFRLTRHVRANPQVLDALPEPITFDARERTPVANRDAFFGRAVTGKPVPLGVAVGQPIESPSLVTLEGEPWSPADRRGRVQVLLAWNLGSVGFRRGFTAIVSIRDHIKSLPTDVPVDYWLVNTREKTEETQDGGGKWDAVYDFWYERRYEIPCLFDDQNAFADAIGLTDVPATMVFDAQGRLVGTQGGLDGTWTRVVTGLIDTAIQQSKAEPATPKTPPTE